MVHSILTTHVGSLPRSKAVTDMIFARERGEPYSKAEFDSIMAAHVEEVVVRQVNAGINIVSDGETSKISYATYIKDRYTGFSGDSKRNPPKDLQLFPSFLERIAREGGTPKYARPICKAEVKAKDYVDLHADIGHFQSALKTHKVKGFMNAASPGVIAMFLPNQYYSNDDDYLTALAEVMEHEYQTIVESGLQLQLDCPDLALSRHMLFADISDEAFIKLAERHVEVLNYSLRNISADQLRVHICWGNYAGPHICDIGMEKVFHYLMKLKARYLLFESANPRHAHEWTVFETRKNDIPEDKVLVPGVIDSTSNFVEHPQLVAQRIRQFTNIVGTERVIAGTDCGFGTFAGFGGVDAEIVYAKLAALSEGASLLN